MERNVPACVWVWTQVRTNKSSQGLHTHLEEPDGPVEGILVQPPLLVQELAGLPVAGWHEEAVVEALAKLLKGEGSLISVLYGGIGMKRLRFM